MRIYGVDFTSTPGNSKPITCAKATLVDGTLTVREIAPFSRFEQFEMFLQTPGPWRAGFDFPFSQPRKLLENLSLAGGWVDSVVALTSGKRDDFVSRLNTYRRDRPRGDKQHLREVDRLARSCSPMMLYGTPVAKMYFEGAPRLFKAGLSILPVRLNNDSRVAVEAYPKLVAQRYPRKAKYKAEKKAQQTSDLKAVREQIVDGLQRCAERDFGFAVELRSAVCQAASNDETGDILDAILCSVQAAWSALQRKPLNGIPENCDCLEGWIVDPLLLAKVQ